MNLEPWQWGLAVAGALCVGLAKTGLAGLGLVVVALFAQVLPTKQASGFVLPLLLCGDVVAVLAYRRHVQARFLWKLFPWTAAGVLLGYFAMGRIDDRAAQRLIGAIIVAMVALQLWRRRAAVRQDAVAREHGVWVAPGTGVGAGFTTLVANAAGPLMTLYLLAMRLPKLEFVGTGAVFFLLLNAFKVPFMADLGLVTADSLRANLLLAPAVLAGAWLGHRLLPRIPQRLFENLALGLSLAAGLRLCW